ncbi:MAG: hypothetical protein M1434_09805 [Chloroflexi bacterium]|nr:hypothetical protein [Chloroflexota bacterium]MCL5275019.1 hypothetical protein [Chloroflexota bacterium]
MADRSTRTLQIMVPGGRTSPQSLAAIIDTIFNKGIEQGERIESIKASIGMMAETLTIDVIISVPIATGKPPVQDNIDDHQQSPPHIRDQGLTIGNTESASWKG